MALPTLLKGGPSQTLTFDCRIIRPIRSFPFALSTARCMRRALGGKSVASRREHRLVPHRRQHRAMRIGSTLRKRPRIHIRAFD
eukprot:2906277-Pleurochrysis_carterae.AAC.3